MADPVTILGAAASAATILDHGIKTLTSLVNFYKECPKDEDVKNLNQDLEASRCIFEDIKEAFNKSSLTRERKDRVEQEVQTCSRNIDRLQRINTEIVKPSKPEKACSCLARPSKQLKYALKKSTLLRLRREIDEIQSRLQFSIGVDLEYGSKDTGNSDFRKYRSMAACP